MKEGAIFTRHEGFVLTCCGAAIGMIVGGVLIAFASNARRDDPPCRYGATPRIVIEQDGEPRKVCGCSGGIEVKP